jgi:branched-chain amino acid transport system substrate-binding protein
MEQLNHSPFFRYLVCYSTEDLAMTTNANLTRRLILQAGAASAALGAPGLLLAQPKPIKIGLIHPVSGGLAYSGSQGRLGCQMAIDAINAAGGIKSMGGAKLEAALADSQSRPEIGVAEVERLQQDGVSAYVLPPNTTRPS